MMSLCNIMLETQHKVSSAVENGFRSHGITAPQSTSHDPGALRAAALIRIEDMLGAVLSHLDGSPADSPTRAKGSDEPRPPPSPARSLRLAQSQIVADAQVWARGSSRTSAPQVRSQSCVLLTAHRMLLRMLSTSRRSDLSLSSGSRPIRRRVCSLKSRAGPTRCVSLCQLSDAHRPAIRSLSPARSMLSSRSRRRSNSLSKCCARPECVCALASCLTRTGFCSADRA